MNRRQKRKVAKRNRLRLAECEASMEAHGRAQCELIGLNPDDYGIHCLDWGPVINDVRDFYRIIMWKNHHPWSRPMMRGAA